MDSLTQVTLGAAVGEAVLGRQLGNRAIMWGAVFGTLPDADIALTPFQDSIQFIVHHRGFSHSLLAVAVATPVLSWIFSRWYRQNRQPISFGRWFLFFLLALLTHILLDCCTVYGTQLFWPFSDVRVAWSNIFIIDPLYTIPFLVCVLICLFLQRMSPWRRSINYLGLAASSAYLLLTLVNKYHVEEVFVSSLARQGINAQRLMTSPTALNNVLWYGIAEDESGYYLGYYSLFDSTSDVAFQSVPRRESLLGKLAGSYELDRLIWFSDDYYCIRPHADGLLVHVLKFGKIDLPGNQELYPFTYLIRHKPNPGMVVERYEAPWNENLESVVTQWWLRLKGI